MNLRRGLGRLTAIVWAFGAGLLFVWSDEVLEPPFADVCEDEVDPPYRECLTEEALRLAESESLTDQLLGRLRGEWDAVDASRNVRRMATERWRGAAVALARRQALWAGLTWGGYVLLVWVASGFRRES